MGGIEPLPCADKLAFNSKKEAQATATVTKWRRGTVLKVYKCHHCSLWHLSSED